MILVKGFLVMLVIGIVVYLIVKSSITPTTPAPPALSSPVLSLTPRPSRIPDQATPIGSSSGAGACEVSDGVLTTSTLTTAETLDDCWFNCASHPFVSCKGIQYNEFDKTCYVQGEHPDSVDESVVATLCYGRQENYTAPNYIVTNTTWNNDNRLYMMECEGKHAGICRESCQEGLVDGKCYHTDDNMKFSECVDLCDSREECRYFFRWATSGVCYFYQFQDNADVTVNNNFHIDTRYGNAHIKPRNLYHVNDEPTFIVTGTKESIPQSEDATIDRWLMYGIMDGLYAPCTPARCPKMFSGTTTEADGYIYYGDKLVYGGQGPVFAYKQGLENGVTEYYFVPHGRHPSTSPAITFTKNVNGAESLTVTFLDGKSHVCSDCTLTEFAPLSGSYTPLKKKTDFEALEDYEMEWGKSSIHG